MKGMPRVLSVVGAALAVGAMEPALAAGYGFYASYETGSVDYEIADLPDGIGDLDVEADTVHTAVGFAMDTEPYGKEVFNYSLRTGIEWLETDHADSQVGRTGDLRLTGISVDNAFTFGVARLDRFRFWLGPQIKVALFAGDFEQQYAPDARALLARVGLGATAGANFRLGDRFTIGTSAAYTYSGYAGHLEGDLLGLGDDENDVLVGPASELSFTISFLF
jgi:hypothetical protein